TSKYIETQPHRKSQWSSRGTSKPYRLGYLAQPLRHTVGHVGSGERVQRRISLPRKQRHLTVERGRSRNSAIFWCGKSCRKWYRITSAYSGGMLASAAIRSSLSTSLCRGQLARSEKVSRTDSSSGMRSKARRLSCRKARRARHRVIAMSQRENFVRSF